MLLSSIRVAACVCACVVQAVMVEKYKPDSVPGGMGAGGMPSGMTI